MFVYVSQQARSDLNVYCLYVCVYWFDILKIFVSGGGGGEGGIGMENSSEGDGCLKLLMKSSHIYY